MMWFGLIVSIAAVPLMYGVGPGWGLWLALLACGAAFTTFCLLYEQPMNRARRRVAQQLDGMSSKGVNSEAYQRLQSSRIQPTADDRKLILTPMRIASLLAGAMGLGLTIWGIVLRVA